MQIDKFDMEKGSGPAFVVLGIVFMTTINIALGASFLAIGAGLIARHKNAQRDADTSDGGAK